MVIELLWLVGLLLTALLLLALLWAWPSAQPPHRVRTALVLGSGGHTAELLKLASSLDPHTYTPRTYYIASTDSLSHDKAREVERGFGERRSYCDTGDYSVVAVPRAREVGQSLLSSIPSTLHSTLLCLPPLLRDKPQLLLCNGPGTCLPIILVTRLLSLFSPTKIVYVESVCRVTSLSLTARLARPFVDSVLVQWRGLEETYRGVTYIGRII